MSATDQLTDGEVVRIAGGFRFTEGPVWLGNCLLFSDIPNNRIVRWESRPEGPWVTTYRWPSGNANGNTLDRHGRLVSCEHSNRRVTRTEPDGAITVLADHYEGKRLNSPNDVVVKSDGAVYFTDPPYGLPQMKEGKELDVQGVYRLSPDGKLTLLVDDFETPNGLCFTPDEKVLYINDSHTRKHIRRFTVNDDGSISGGEVFAEVPKDRPGTVDGMKVDTDGRVYSTGPGGIWVFAPDGAQLAHIEVPEIPANLAWGDADWKTLYVTARTSLYRVRMKTQGMAVG